MNPLLRLCLLATLALVGAAWAAPEDIAQTPLSVTQTVRPMVLLAMSRDHQLFRKAYNDYSDLNGDGAIDTTYINDYDYYGYFDPNKCYTYSVSGYFSPTAASVDHQCSGAWSGNLLNWAAMTRMDVLRRVLYGGYRSTDYPDATHTSTQTILERALLPTDSHAFAKVFAPAGGATDMALYTPYSSDATITFCNVTWVPIGTTIESQASGMSAYPPLIRVAKGSYPMWASGEVVECPWSGEYNNTTAPAKTSGNVDFNARVAVCVAGLLEDNCRDYKDDSNVVRNKPIGLLQQYGENGSLRFGLMSGSYTKNKSGGVLRRRMGLIAGNTTASLNEIDLKTGVFTNNAGIIKTINALRINKYQYSSHNYQDNCATAGILTFNNGVCTNWGNPIAEIYLESLRYFAAKGAPYATYNTSDSTYFGALAQITTWEDPLQPNVSIPAEWCAKCNIIFLSTGVNSFDRDEFSTDFTGLNPTTATNTIGSQEGIGTNLIVGGTTGRCTAKTGTTLGSAQGVCPEGPTLTGGYLLAGLAHFAHTTGLRRVMDHQQKINTQTVALARDLPRFQIAVGSNTVTLLPHMEANSTGTAVQATAGWRASTMQDLIVESMIKDAGGKLIGGSLKVIWEDSTWGNDYDMDGVERIKFCVGSAACNQSCAACIACNNTCATCTAAYNACTTAYTACTTAYTTCTTARTACTNTCNAICDTDYTTCRKTKTDAVCSPIRTSCKTACTTSCATQYPCVTCTACTACTSQCACTSVCPTECSLTVGDTDLQITTSVQQAQAGHALLFGYTVAGTVAGSTPTNTACDGVYHGDGVYREVVRVGNKNFSMLTEPPTNPANKPTDCTRKFTAGTTTARLLEHPLWYAAKYGGFVDSNGNALPDRESEWDSNGDGIPDRFFYADNPAELGTSLANFLDVIATVSSSASVVANSITLNEDTRIFQGRYDSSDWSGDLVAFPVNANGSLATLVWSGRTHVDTQAAANSRRILTTYEDSTPGVPYRGVPFQWGDLAAGQKTALRRACATCAIDAESVGQARLGFLRGSSANEAANGGALRTRIHVMGDVVNSDPVYVGAPLSFYPDDLEPASYRDFAEAQAARPSVIYVGANDGMVHGFNAQTGAEVFAYIPRALYAKLPELAALDYKGEGKHRAYVDGGPTAGDAYLHGAAQWRTLLVGGLGAGGRGVYAIDVTDPTDFLSSESAAAAKVKWDIVGGDPYFTGLGYTYSKPAIVRLPGTNSHWVAVFGNGYKSPDGRASLYVVDAETGEWLNEVVVDAGPGNGLSSVAPIDYGGDGAVDYLYAGDLKGNLWRFEATADGIGKSFTGAAPLFNDAVSVGGTTSPITVRPEVVRHPAGGVVVTFGTGAYFREGDRTPNASVINALYGIWDQLDQDHPVSSIRRADLLKQQILAQSVAGDFDVRVTSANTLIWYATRGAKPTDQPSTPPSYLGWYLELRDPLDGTARGEVQVTDPQARGGRIIYTTLLPSDPNTDHCSFGGDGWLMELNALTGSRMSEPVYDLNADTVFNLADMVTVQVSGQDITAVPTGKKSTVGIIQEPAIIGAGTKEYKYASGAREAAIEVTIENPGNAAGGRRSWLQLH